MLRYILGIVIAFAAIEVSAAKKRVSSEFDSIGVNKGIARRARTFDPDNRIRIVQKRLVPRSWRLEIAGEYGFVAGGDTYTNVTNPGVRAEFHITPRWSLGYRYSSPEVEITPEGKRILSAAAAAEAAGNNTLAFPAIDIPTSSSLATLSYYPLYGKINLFNQKIIQFDAYGLVGAGQKTLRSFRQKNEYSTSQFAVGVGMGFWFSQYITARVEALYQTYTDRPDGFDRELSEGIISASLGVFAW